MKIAGVVVTYNRLELLTKCIYALRSQTRKLDEIIVINNSSTDGTLTWLNDQEDLLVITQKNTGSSGGQYSGIKVALEKGFNWIWCMDDDSEPSPDCLEKLSLHMDDNTSFLAPIVYGNKIKDFEWYHHKKIFIRLFNVKQIGSQFWLKSAFIKKQNEVKYKIDANGFVGPLINSNVVKKIGLPREDFFILIDDTEYTYRLSNYLPGYLITNALIYHHDIPVQIGKIDRENIKSYWKQYFYVRNKILFNKIYIGNIRIIIYAIWLLVGYSIHSLVYYKKGKYLLLKLQIKGLFDGLFYDKKTD